MKGNEENIKRNKKEVLEKRERKEKVKRIAMHNTFKKRSMKLKTPSAECQEMEEEEELDQILQLFLWKSLVKKVSEYLVDCDHKARLDISSPDMNCSSSKQEKGTLLSVQLLSSCFSLWIVFI